MVLSDIKRKYLKLATNAKVRNVQKVHFAYSYLQPECIVAFFHFCTIGWEMRQFQGVNRVEIALMNNIAKFTKEDNACDALRFSEVSGFTRSRVCSYRFCKKFSEYLLPTYYVHRHNWTGNWVIKKYSKEHNISTCFEIFPANTAVRIFMISGI